MWITQTLPHSRVVNSQHASARCRHCSFRSADRVNVQLRCLRCSLPTQYWSTMQCIGWYINTDITLETHNKCIPLGPRTDAYWWWVPSKATWWPAQSRRALGGWALDGSRRRLRESHKIWFMAVPMAAGNDCSLGGPEMLNRKTETWRKNNHQRDPRSTRVRVAKLVCAATVSVATTITSEKPQNWEAQLSQEAQRNPEQKACSSMIFENSRDFMIFGDGLVAQWDAWHLLQCGAKGDLTQGTILLHVPQI